MNGTYVVEEEMGDSHSELKWSCTSVLWLVTLMGAELGKITQAGNHVALWIYVTCK